MNLTPFTNLSFLYKPCKNERYSASWLIMPALFFAACSENKMAEMKQEQTITEELKKISTLLQDGNFALELAKKQEAAYYASQEQAAPAFLPGNAIC